MTDFYRTRIETQRQLLSAIEADEAFLAAVTRAGEMMVETFRTGGRMLLCGNGGSAADAQHIAAELVARFYKERAALDAEALTVNSSTLTAVANDYAYDTVFARQVEAKGRPGDLLVGITTSGSSPNVVAALTAARQRGMATLLLTGGRPNPAAAPHADLTVAVPSTTTPRIQEVHILLGHLWCEQVEQTLFP